MSRDEKTFEELLNQSEVKDWLHRAEREMFPKMKNSVFSMVLGNSEPDARLALEIGAAVLFDKPLLIVALKGWKVPATLRRVAHTIVEIDDFRGDEGQEKVRRAIQAMLPGERLK